LFLPTRRFDQHPRSSPQSRSSRITPPPRSAVAALLNIALVGDLGMIPTV
jgi:hypothetical protein